MLLETITGPADLKRLTVDELTALAEEVRARLIDCIPKTGGHFSPNLGTVELTVALLAAFDSPRDRIVWDVGHQAYAHKVLTGRNDRLETLRQLGGLCGFLAREESEHDAFGATPAPRSAPRSAWPPASTCAAIPTTRSRSSAMGR